MTEFEKYKEHIQHTHNAFCRVVIRHAAIDAARRVHKRREREISLDYLMDEKYYPFSTTDEYFAEPTPDIDYPFTVCGQTVLLSNPILAAALPLLSEHEQEVIFLYFFQRQTQKEIGMRYGRTRSTTGRQIQIALQHLRKEMEVLSHEPASPL
ncbi:MAG: RNA polymerase sigma factor [Enterocloster aldenensis]|uniref:RNA polymerase sigma factor n=1 Tax=Hungatella effluvii TaxID=1096246 RepID=UPI001F5AFEC3|nr:sigma factor-like helix-turn-helix DNA-binding protein [Hungatella effluvii]MCI5489986.1 sigma-70 family RNA polymerase sigma factor [Enterocloster aldenensis]